MRLNTKAFAFASALVWGMGIFLLTWWIMAFEGASGDATWIAQVYRGYRISPAGSVIGLAWATVDGLVFGALFASAYNALAQGSARD